MEKAVESRAMLTVTHAMSFVTSSAGNCVRKSQWFKHPDSLDDCWWLVTSDIENQMATISIMVEKCRNLLSEASSEVLDVPFIICANECKVYKKVTSPGQQTMSKFLLPGTKPFNVHRVTVTRKRYKVLKVKFGGVPTQLTIVVSFTLLNDKKMQQQLMLYLLRPVSFAHEMLHPDVAAIGHSFAEAVEFADILLEMKDGKSISVHKGILMAYSPVFKAMFLHDTVEKRKNKVVIHDVSLRAMTEALRFLYSGQVNFVEMDMDTLLELVELSERYVLLPLKVVCESALVDCLYREDGWIFPEYAFDLLPLANLYRMFTLKEVCQVALAWHIRDHTVEYFKLALDYEAELLRKFAFERLIALRQPHFQEDGWKELERAYPQEVQALVVAQINAHGSSPGITIYDKD